MPTGRMINGGLTMTDAGGVWRTISGRRVFIRDGQSLTDAMRDSGKFDALEKQNKDKPTQDELRADYENVEAMWDMTAEERYRLALKYSQQKADDSNFFENSVGFWELRSKKPVGEPDHISYNRRTGKISSKYWYTKEGVYRQSNHWGSDVASCSWYIKGRTYANEGVSVGKTETAFIKWGDLKAKGLISKHWQTGVYALVGFEFKKQ